MACAPLREPGTVLSEGGIRGPAPEKVFHSVPFCAVSYVAGGTPGNSLGRFWRTNGRQMDAFGTKWNGLLGGVGGGAAVYLLFRSRTYNSTESSCQSRLAEVFSTGIVPMRQMSLIPTRPPFGNWRLGPHTPCLAADRLPEGRTPSRTPPSYLMESERFPAVMGKFTLVVDLGGKLQLQRRLARLPSKVEGS